MMLFFVNANAQQTFNKLNVKELTSNNIQVTSTTKGSKPCPVMTEAQRDAVVGAVLGDCITNSTTLQLNVYNGTIWKSAGGGISNWETAFNYAINDVVIQSNNIYQANNAHTSGVFASQLANWIELANNVSSSTGILPLANGGTNKNITAANGSIPYTDTDSFEMLAAGTSGQILQTNGAGAPTFVNKSISAKAENTSLVTLEEMQVPNNLLTTTAANKSLNETGNHNLLVNPSFEHSTPSTGWTLSGCTSAAEATIVAHGKQSLKISCAAQTLKIYQDTTLYATYLSGQNSQRSVQVYSTVSGVSVCSGGATVASAKNCVVVSELNKFGLYEAPEPISASNGLYIVSSGNITGDIYLDDSKIDPSMAIGSSDQSRIAGESYFAGTASALCARTSTTLGALTCNAALPGPTIVRSSLGVFETTDSNFLRQTVTNLPAGTYKAKFIFASNMNTAAAGTSFAINDGTTTCFGVEGNGGTAARAAGTIECSFAYTSSGTRVFELYAASTANQLEIGNERTSPAAGTKFILEYFGSGQTYSSQCGANCVDTFTAKISAAGVVSDENVDWINGNMTISGTSVFTGTYATGAFTVIPNCRITSALSTSGGGQSSLRNAMSTATLEYATFSSAGGLQANAVNIACTKTGADFIASRTIVGSFKDVVTVKNTTKPKLFGFEISAAGVVSLDTEEAINGNCGLVTNTFTCTLETDYCTTAPKCNIDLTGGSSGESSFNTLNTTTIITRTFNSAGSNSALAHLVNCRCGGL